MWALRGGGGDSHVGSVGPARGWEGEREWKRGKRKGNGSGGSRNGKRGERDASLSLLCVDSGKCGDP
eukprot:362445-Chlamydomonas_euryale.AAC.4